MNDEYATLKNSCSILNNISQNNLQNTLNTCESISPSKEEASTRSFENSNHFNKENELLKAYFVDKNDENLGKLNLGSMKNNNAQSLLPKKTFKYFETKKKSCDFTTPLPKSKND